ncbi:MAG: hypothetical protein COA79_06575 [Planctomycetota bacterium]|nr:MAG: hypothetical protein COA79_06575 [Planctomycetota bacterium]
MTFKSLFLLICLTSSLFLFSDEVMLQNGRRYHGKIIEEKNGRVKFKVEIDKASVTKYFDISNVRYYKINGKKVKAGSLEKKVKKVAVPTLKLSEEEINLLVEDMGTTSTDWYNSIELNYPKTMLTKWEKYRGWNNQKVPNHYKMDIINPNEERWKEGTKFFHYLVRVNDDNKDGLIKSLNELASCYGDLLLDFPRGIYWFKKSLSLRNSYPIRTSLAYYYWKLGSKSLATKTLHRIKVDHTKYGSLIRLLTNMKEYERAIKLKKRRMRRWPGTTRLALAQLFRKKNELEKSIDHLNQILELKSRNKNRYKKIKILAKENLMAIQRYQKIEKNKLPDGIYYGSSLGFDEKSLTVEVKIKDNKFTSIIVKDHKEKQFYSSLVDIPSQILKSQSLQSVDAISGATLTSDAILNATIKSFTKE